ncbi:MAG: 2-amino-4-hydroxy-6-hydroxymethyldihydropteridine diphosphokinase [Chitinivibrionales bacterium]|nr:2-amino-4-hydroxy-6-hydroxymethyldihydropteridine diphosphokinase [Chitinivibrionales bacterium]MBD3396474.1 2-amino-4-hydroxy-6-hydroxymethyldihydropteridine diphosphokinase [Chitinivibrionales bacterium]
MNRAIIGIGSNIDPEKNIGSAREALRADPRVSIVSISQFVTTKPVGDPDQPDFLNGAAMVETGLSIHDLKALLRGMEDRLGRIRTDNRYAPRTIDLDIVVWNGTILDNDYYTRTFLRDAVSELGIEETALKKSSENE